MSQNFINNYCSKLTCSHTYNPYSSFILLPMIFPLLKVLLTNTFVNSSSISVKIFFLYLLSLENSVLLMSYSLHETKKYNKGAKSDEYDEGGWPYSSLKACPTRWDLWEFSKSSIHDPLFQAASSSHNCFKTSRLTMLFFFIWTASIHSWWTDPWE